MSLNASVLSAGATLDVLKRGWSAQQNGKLTAAWMLHGRPGVGKSQLVAELADAIGARLFDLRLTTIEPQDLRGLPYYDHTQQKTVWYRPEDLPDDPDRPAILFLDELTAASPYLQPTVYGLLQERRVGQHRLPQNVMILAAGNTVQDGAIAYEMGTALSDRLIHLHVEADIEDWLTRYAGPRGLHPAVTAFLRSRPELLDTIEETISRRDTIACTPRAWERVSHIMGAIPDRSARAAMIAGTVGAAVAAEFLTVAEDIAGTVDAEALLAAAPADRAALYPQHLHGLNALVFALVARADAASLPEIIEVMEGIRHLAGKRAEPVYATLPLAELCAYGFEMLLTKALENGWQSAFAQSQTYRGYQSDLQAQGVI